MKTLRLMCALACWLPAFALACPSQDCVRIGTWNIAWLGSEKREQSSDAETLQQMAHLIADEWDIDLIALQEINTAIDGRSRYGEQHTTAAWQQLRAALARKGYQTRIGESGEAQRIVLAWRSPVVALKPATELAIPDSYQLDEFCRSAGLRRPLAGQFRAGAFDFWAVAVHLKSGYGGNTACSNAVRAEQTRLMAQKATAMLQQDRDIILLGDFNASSRHDSLQPLRERGWVSLTDKEKRDQGSYNRTQGLGKRGSIIDQLMIVPGSTGEWRPRSTMIHAPADLSTFGRRYSDHLPVWADFSTRQDDD